MLEKDSLETSYADVLGRYETDENSYDLFAMETHWAENNAHRTHNERGKLAYQANLYKYNMQLLQTMPCRRH